MNIPITNSTAFHQRTSRNHLSMIPGGLRINMVLMMVANNIATNVTVGITN